MDFMYYYPAQYRGTTSEGTPAPFEMCGAHADGSGGQLTLCGAQYQQGTTWALSGAGAEQVDKGSTDIPDPMNFSIANKAANIVAGITECSSDISGTFSFTSPLP